MFAILKKQICTQWEESLTRDMGGVVFLTTPETIQEMHTSRKTFYANIRPQLQAHFFDGKKAPWYKKTDIIDLKNGRVVRKASISISGIQKDWSMYLRSLGYRVGTIDRSIEENVFLPQDAIDFFLLSASEKFVKRSRVTFANDMPICAWSTYYPISLIGGSILDKMKDSVEVDVVQLIKEQHNIAVSIAKDKYTARSATFEEQELLQLISNDPILVLQRASYTENREQLVLYSDMSLLGSWFAPEHEYKVDIWK
jgi:DNA-binding GntR family transcriptional regulator